VRVRADPPRWRRWWNRRRGIVESLGNPLDVDVTLWLPSGETVVIPRRGMARGRWHRADLEVAQVSDDLSLDLGDRRWTYVATFEERSLTAREWLRTRVGGHPDPRVLD